MAITSVLSVHDKILEWFETELTKVWDIELEGLLGPPDEPDCDHQLATLNRLLTWTSSGIEWEADPRHVKILLQALDIANCKGVSAPGLKEKTSGDVEAPAPWNPSFGESRQNSKNQFEGMVPVP